MAVFALPAAYMNVAQVIATRAIAAFTAATGFATTMPTTATMSTTATAARALCHGLCWTESDQGKQHRKGRHVASHETHSFRLH
jgi:hypothetical protein